MESSVPLNFPIVKTDLEYSDINQEAYQFAMNGYKKLSKNDSIDKILAIADFSKPSTSKRLYIFNVATGKLLYKTYVAHGKNSGENFATQFSNQSNSNKSSLGFYTTGAIYNGKHGTSLQLNGLEKGINDNALSRAIVLHGADYVSEEFISQNQRLGRSQGCPSVSSKDVKTVINLLKNKACFFIYAPDKTYKHASTFATALVQGS